MLDNKEVWGRYLENLNIFLELEDQEIVSYTKNLIQQSNNLKKGIISFTEYKLIPEIPIYCNEKKNDMIKTINSFCNDFANEKISLNEFRENIKDLLDRNIDRKKFTERNQINYIKNQMISWYWKSE